MSAADKLRDLHAKGRDGRWNPDDPMEDACIAAAEKVDPAEGRHWNRSDSQALTDALAALNARLTDTSDGDAA